MATITSHLLTIIVIGSIVAFMIYSLMSSSSRIVSTAPTILTSMGIFGTFLGIAIGLLNFDPADIRGSVPNLFGGIQMAFWSSVSGILAGLLVRFKNLLMPIPGTEGGKGGRATIDDLLRAMRGVEKSLSDEDQSPLISGLRNMNRDTSARLDEMKKAMSGLHAAVSAGEREAALLNKLDAVARSSAAAAEAMGAAAAGRDAALLGKLDALAKGSAAAAEALGAAAAGRDAALLGKLDSLAKGSVAAADALGAAVAGRDAALMNKLDALAKGSIAAAEAMGAAVTGRDAAMLGKLDTLAAGTAAAADMISAAAAARDTALLGRLDALAKNSAAAAEALGAAAAGRDQGLMSKLDAMARNTAVAAEALQRETLTGLDSLAKSSAVQFDDLVKRLGAGQADLMGRLQGGFLDELQKLRQDSAARLGDLNRTMENVYGALMARDDTAAMLDKMDAMHRDSNAKLDDLRKTMTGVAGLLSTDKETALLGKIDQLARGSSAGMEAALRDSKAGLDALAKLTGDQFDEMSKRFGAGQAELMNRMQAAFLDELQKLRQDSNAKLSDLNRTMENVYAALMSGEDTAATLDKLDSLRQASEAMGGDLGRAIGQLHGALVGGEGSLLSQLGRAGRETAEQLGGVTRAIEDMRKAMGGDFARAVGDLHHALVGSDSNSLASQLLRGGRETAEQMQGVARAIGDLRNALGGDTSAMLDKMEALRTGSEALGENLGRAVGQLQGALVGGDAGSLAGQLARASKEAAEQMQGVSKSIGDLRQALVGPEGAAAALVDQIRQGQSDANKTLGAIKSAVDENTKRQVDYSPRALMGVLEEMVRQFNTQFSGQFWDKFGNFNQGIGKVLEWMETYRKQMSEMIDQQSRAAQNMDTAARRFDDVASKAEIFIDVSKNISGLLTGLDTQRVQLESHLKRFAHIVDVTSADLEDIEHKIVRSNEEMNNHIRQISRHIEEQVIRLDHALDEELTKAMNTFGQQLAALSEKFVDDYTPLTERLRDVVNIARGV